jgi:hypothetical protein
VHQNFLRESFAAGHQQFNLSIKKFIATPEICVPPIISFIRARKRDEVLSLISFGITIASTLPGFERSTNFDTASSRDPFSLDRGFTPHFSPFGVSSIIHSIESPRDAILNVGRFDFGFSCFSPSRIIGHFCARIARQAQRFQPRAALKDLTLGKARGLIVFENSEIRLSKQFHSALSWMAGECEIALLELLELVGDRFEHRSKVCDTPFDLRIPSFEWFAIWRNQGNAATHAFSTFHQGVSPFSSDHVHETFGGGRHSTMRTDWSNLRIA